MSAGISNTFSKVYTMILSNGAAKVIGLLAIPILARVFDPISFGTLAFYTAIVTILVPIVTLKYSLAIQLPKSEILTRRLLISVCALSSFNILLLTVLLWISMTFFINETIKDKLEPFWFIIPFGLFARSMIEIFEQLSLRNKKYNYLNIINILQSLISSLSKVGLGFLSILNLGLIYGQVVSFLTISFVYLWGGRKLLLKKVSSKRLLYTLRRYKTFPLYRMPSQLILNLTTQLPILIIGYLYSPEDLGQYSMAMVFIALPVQIISTSVGKVYFAEISRSRREGFIRIKDYTNNFIIRMTLIGVVISSSLYIGAPYLVPIVLGDGWELSVQLIQVLCMLAIAQLSINPIINIYTVFENNKEFLKINITRLILVCICFVITYFKKLSIIDFTLLYSLTLLSQYLLVYFKVKRFIKYL